MGLHEYLTKCEGKYVSDRKIMADLGLSKGALYRAKKRLEKSGRLSYEVDRCYGTKYQTSGAPSGAPRQKSGAPTIQLIKGNTAKERETRPRTRERREVEAVEGRELEAVLTAWAKYRGRVLIEDEVAEMASWQTQLGEKRLCELIAKAWRRCTADRMSIGYFADYYVTPELNGAPKRGTQSGALKAGHQNEASKRPAVPVKERSNANDGRRQETMRAKEAGTRTGVRAKPEPKTNTRTPSHEEVAAALQELRRRSLPKHESDIFGSSG